MKTLLGVLAVAVACGVWAADSARPAPPAEQPTAAEILDRCVKVSGGQAAWDSQKTLIWQARISVHREPPLAARVTMHAKRPDKLHVFQRWNGGDDIVTAYDGRTGWQRDAAGFRLLRGQALANLRLIAHFHYLVDWRRLFEKVELRGVQPINERPAYEILLTHETASPMTCFFDVETGILVRSDTIQVQGDQEIRLQTYFGDFRESGGVLTPFRMSQVSPLGRVETEVTGIQYNVPVSDALFSPPRPQPAPR